MKKNVNISMTIFFHVWSSIVLCYHMFIDKSFMKNKNINGFNSAPCSKPTVYDNYITTGQ